MSELKKPCAVCGLRLSSNDLIKHENKCFDKIQSKHELYKSNAQNKSRENEEKTTLMEDSRSGSNAVSKGSTSSTTKAQSSSQSTSKSPDTLPVQVKDGGIPIKTINYDNKQSSSAKTDSKNSINESSESDSSIKLIDIPMTPEKAQQQALLAEIRSDKSKKLKRVRNIVKGINSEESDKETESYTNTKSNTSEESNNLHRNPPKDLKSKRDSIKKAKQNQSNKENNGKDDQKVDIDKKEGELDGNEEQKSATESEPSDKELLERNPYPKLTKDDDEERDDKSSQEKLPGSEGYSNQLPDLNEENEAAYRSHLNNLVPCSFCGRKFNPDRIMIHENACIERPKKREYITPDKNEKK